MALTFDACLFPQGSGTNEIYGDCCCSITCTITADSNVRIDDLVTFFSMESFSLVAAKFYIGNNVQALPLVINANESFDLEIQICASSAGNSDSLSLDFILGTGGSEQFEFDFSAIDLSTSIDVASIDFANVPIGSSANVAVTIYNPTLCCYNYDLSVDCAEIQVDNTSTNKLCSTDSQIINVLYTPTVAGSISCTLALANECQSLSIPITASAIAPETSGSSNGQKNKVDQTTPVTNCSPRTTNNRCNTSRTMQSAIRSNAKRFGKR